MLVQYPKDFNCYDFFNDMSDERINEMIEELKQKLDENPRMSMAMKNCENAGVLMIKQKDHKTKEPVLRIIVMKNHWETIVPIKELDTVKTK